MADFKRILEGFFRRRGIYGDDRKSLLEAFRNAGTKLTGTLNKAVSGIAGNGGNLAEWDSNGNLVDSGHSTDQDLETTSDVREKQSSARAGRFCGHNHPRAKPVNIYDYDTNQIVAENVVVSDWAPRNGYHQAHITATATGKLNKHKGVYARYVDSTENSGFT